MRTIKVKAWDKERKEMCLVDRLQFMFESDDGIMAEVVESRLTPSTDKYRRMIMPENLILLLYIDRKDKNKVELCEGDILRDNDDGWIGYIVYMNGGYILVQHEGENGEMMTRPEWDEWEKIGNKFENPELLERN